ncbi:MAG: protein kinase [Gammaproteobacteria bacterium]|nr:protein kinase [Gammaproteobacteria bacterium]
MNLENHTLGKYQIVKLLGQGGMGTVYLGQDPFIDRPVAIKVALDEKINASDTGDMYRRMFFNEAQAAGILKHPNITSIFDAGMENGLYYIVMEYVHGGRTLDEHTSENDLLTPGEVASIIYKAAMALDYAHRKGVIHRDIKPRNILLTADNDVKISDFGVAVMPGVEDASLPASAGSPLYMSPEQIREETLNGQSDLFALGTLTYELLTGTHPFTASNFDAIQHQIQRSTPRPLNDLRPDIPDVFQLICDRALAKKPAQRYKSGVDMAGDLTLVFDFLNSAITATPRQQRFASLRDMAFFDEFSDAELWEVVSCSDWVTLDGEQEIIQEGSREAAFYVLVSGRAQVRKGDRGIFELRSGDCFGEMGFVSGHARSASIKALRPVTLLRMTQESMEQASADCQLRFQKRFLHALIDRLDATTEALAEQSVAGTE